VPIPWFVERVFRPATTILGRLRFAVKFLVVGLVLAVPLGVVAFAYSQEQSSAVDATNTERIGWAAMEPLVRLSQDVVAARHAAVISGAGASVPAADIQAVDRTQDRFGASLGTEGQWHELRQQLVIAGLTTGHATALAAYDGVEIGLGALLQSVSDGAKLSVDPDLDAAYLVDVVDVRVPQLVDTATRMVDQLHVDAGDGGSHQLEVQLLSQLGVTLGTIDSTDSALDRAIHTAAGHTRDSGASTEIPARMSLLDAAVSQLEVTLRNAEFTHNFRVVSASAAQPLAAAAAALSQSSTSAIDRLLTARIARDNERAHLVELLVAAAALAAIYLFSGFYYCVAGAVRRMITTLGAVAGGRLDARVAIANRDELGFVATAINDMVGKVRHATERLAHDATHDGLTGLPNRSFIMGQLERSLPRTSPEQSLSLLFIDLDGFKPINDSLGHGVGDDVLIEVARRLATTTRPTDTVARLAGDEFLIVCRGLPDVLDAITVAERVLAAIAPRIPVQTSDHELRHVSLGASIGVTHVTDPATSPEELIRDADVAMYRAKELGRGRIEIFDQALRADAEQRQQMREDLGQAITGREIEVHYQPIVELEDGRIKGFEALVRWDHPERGLLAPGAFMATAESSGLIVSLGAHVLREACRQLAIWQADSAMPRGLHMSVNLSAKQLLDGDIADVVAAAVSDAGIDPQSLWLEITESSLLTDADNAAGMLLKLRETGVRLAVDDFGTGYSSLQHLKLFPLDVIKVDRSFVSGLGEDDGDEAIVRSVIELAGAFGFTVVAEGVETPLQRTWLIDLGCELAQGYLFARPGPPREIAALVAAT
jgi:diguanylate cyclase (GGDEF)-like protein